MPGETPCYYRPWLKCDPRNCPNYPWVKEYFDNLPLVKSEDIVPEQMIIYMQRAPSKTKKLFADNLEQKRPEEAELCFRLKNIR